ncbi:MAG: energy transducer TonB [Bacteroidota bacterium]|nr:energy transducer TonB [Bacteroidota bacterium]
MSRKIQFHTFHLLFRLFSYLADKSGGWSLFVRPKLVIGALIVGLGISTPDITFAQPKTSIQKGQSYFTKKKRKTKKKLIYKRSHQVEDVTVVTTCYTTLIEDDKEPRPKVILSDTVIYDQADQSQFKEPYIKDRVGECKNSIELMQKLVSENLIYPPKAIKKKIEGTVVCSFIIDKQGILKDIEVIKSVHPLLDAEARRILYKFPDWIPAKKIDRTVVVKYTLPIRFSLPQKK